MCPSNQASLGTPARSQSPTWATSPLGLALAALPCQNASWMNQNASGAGQKPADADDPVVVRATQRALARRQAVYADEGRRLLDAGLEVMRQSGTTQSPRVADIVDVAGLSRDAFYRHFASK